MYQKTVKPEPMLITKEQFLDSTTEDEVFCLIVEALAWLKENRKKVNPNYDDVIATDRELGTVTEQMITNIKGQVWLP